MQPSSRDSIVEMNGLVLSASFPSTRTRTKKTMVFRLPTALVMRWRLALVFSLSMAVTPSMFLGRNEAARETGINKTVAEIVEESQQSELTFPDRSGIKTP